jgi:hypothetical protein
MILQIFLNIFFKREYIASVSDLRVTHGNSPRHVIGGKSMEIFLSGTNYFFYLTFFKTIK